MMNKITYSTSKRLTRWLSIMLVFIMLFAMTPSVYAGSLIVDESSCDILNGWELEDGYSVTGTWVYEGSYALEHTGSTSSTVSDKRERER